MAKKNIVVELYDKGLLTEQTALIELFETATLGDIEELPELWLNKLKEYVDGLPTNDKDWSKRTTVQSWCGIGDPPTQEEIQSFHKERASLLREIL